VSVVFRPLRLDTGTAGAVLLHSMPGRLEHWDDFLRAARAAQVVRVACLTPLDEVALLSPVYHAAIVSGGLPFAWTALPMHNFGLASDALAFRAGIAALADAVGAGDTVVLHCAAGIGRTGTAAACLLKRLGVATPEVVQRVREAGSRPESALQGGLIESF